jgi:hypothetical protein
MFAYASTHMTNTTMIISTRKVKRYHRACSQNETRRFIEKRIQSEAFLAMFAV